MDNKLVISYTPDQIDEAVKQHIERTTGYTGDAKIDYTHKRTLKKVSAQITLNDPVRVSRAAEEAVKVVETILSDEIIMGGGIEELTQGEEIKVIEFEDLPEHEQVEAMMENGVDELEGIVEHMQTEDENIDFLPMTEDHDNDSMFGEDAETEAEELRKESREADSELEVPETKSDADLESLFG